MKFNGKSSSQVKYNLVTNILRAPVLVDLIHSLQNFAWITINNRRKMRSRFSFFCSLYTIIITIKNNVSIRRFSFYFSIPWSIWERLSKRVWRWSIKLWQCRKMWAVVSLSKGQLINASRVSWNFMFSKITERHSDPF